MFIDVRALLVAAAVAVGWVLKPIDLEVFTDDDFRSIIRERGGAIPC